MQKVLFIINPASGTGRKEHIVNQIHAFCTDKKMNHSILYSEAPGHATTLSESAAKSEFEAVIAAGGDGTVNEVGAGLFRTETALGILPLGSGNGLARHLNLPLSVKAALERIAKGRTTRIDTGVLNGRPFFCTSGNGIDAHVSQLFATAPRRGFWSYAKISFRELLRYQPQIYTLEINGEVRQHEALLVTVANASQFGNNAYIAPGADCSDGELDVCIVRPHSKLAYPVAAWQLFRRSLSRNRNWQRIRTPNVVIRRAEAAPVHLDGDPLLEPAELRYEVIPQSLSVIV